MSFRQASGRETCNSCRKRLDAGAPVYVGELTPAFWCESCALEMGKAPGGPVPAVRPVDGMEGIAAGTRALAKKYRFTPPASWQERE
ncbi:MAG: hypothetical protein KAY59_04395 [Acidobacteria bacterium]|nr:hypothetical protein [Acidobacteriota bacterium]